MALFPAIQLVFGEVLGLLAAMVCCIQHGHCMLTKAFCKEATSKKATKALLKDGLSPWIELHCLVLMKPGEEPAEACNMPSFVALKVLVGI